MFELLYGTYYEAENGMLISEFFDTKEEALEFIDTYAYDSEVAQIIDPDGGIWVVRGEE